jgi:chemotaxis protein CheD
MIQEKIQVFIVDDSSLVRNLLTKGLALDAAISIIGSAEHGQDALNQLRTLAPDVVVTDMDMPVMNGLEFIEKLMATRPMPIVLLSSWAQNDKVITQQALEAGAADFIAKPTALNPNGFQETLKRLVVKIKTVAANRSRIGSVVPNALSTQHPAAQLPQQTVQPTLGSAAAPAGAFADKREPLNLEKRSNQTILGIGELAATKTPGTVLKTFALGSCVAVHLFSPANDVVGMVHIALPASSIAPDKAKSLPGYFADTAITALIETMRSLGYTKPVPHLTAKIVGGALTAADTSNHFKIGERNIAAVKYVLQALNIPLAAEDVGGNNSRTVFVEFGSQTVHISLADRSMWNI